MHALLTVDMQYKILQKTRGPKVARRRGDRRARGTDGSAIHIDPFSSGSSCASSARETSCQSSGSFVATIVKVRKGLLRRSIGNFHDNFNNIDDNLLITFA